LACFPCRILEGTLKSCRILPSRGMSILCHWVRYCRGRGTTKVEYAEKMIAQLPSSAHKSTRRSNRWLQDLWNESALWYSLQNWSLLAEGWLSSLDCGFSKWKEPICRISCRIGGLLWMPVQDFVKEFDLAISRRFHFLWLSRCYHRLSRSCLPAWNSQE